MDKIEMPDFTPPAIAALIGGMITDGLLLFVVNLSDARQGALLGFVNAAVLSAFLIHDAIVRHGRARIAVAQIVDAATSRDLGKAEGRPGS